MLHCKILKKRIMKYKKFISVTLATVALLCIVTLSSCKKDFFEIADPNGFEVVDSWDDEGAVGLFLNRTYALVIPQWPTLGGIHNTSDELNNANTAFLYGTLTEKLCYRYRYQLKSYR